MSQRGYSGQKRPFLGGLLLAGLLGVGGLSACGSSSTDTGTSVRSDPLTFSASSVPVGYVGEDYKASLLVSGGVGPYGYRLTSGNLPPGLSFSNGQLTGKPTAQGSYKFTVEANDANLSNKVASYTLNVNDLPPLSLEPTLPSGDIRGETRVPITIKAPRAVRAVRLVWDVGPDMQVTRVQSGDNTSPVFWRQEGNVLSVDLGFKTVPRSGARVALISVKPRKPGALGGSDFWYESRDGAGKILSEKKRPEPVQAPAPASTPTTVPDSTAPANAAPGTTPSTPTDSSTSTPAPATTPTTTPATPAPTTPANPTTPTPPGTPTDGTK